MKTKCLIADDNDNLRKELAKELRRSLLISDVLEASSGEQALELYKKYRQHIGSVLLDLDFSEKPDADKDGFYVLNSIRSMSSVLTGVWTSDELKEREDESYELGADFYLWKSRYSKPIHVRHRLEIHLTRQESSSSKNTSRVYTFEGWTLDESRRRLTNPDNAEVTLTPLEFDLLVVLVNSPQNVLSHNEIFEQLGPLAPSGKQPNVAFAKILSRLRDKIDNDRKESHIKTVHGQGLMFTSTVNMPNQ